MPHFVFDPAGRDRSVSAPRSGLSWSNQDGVAGPPTLNGTVGVAGGGTGATAAQAAWLRSRVSTFSALRRLDHPILAVRPRPHWRRSPSRRMRWGRMGSCVSPRSGAIRAAPEAGRQGSSSTERHSLSRPHLRTQAFPLASKRRSQSQRDKLAAWHCPGTRKLGRQPYGRCHIFACRHRGAEHHDHRAVGERCGHDHTPRLYGRAGGAVIGWCWRVGHAVPPLADPLFELRAIVCVQLRHDRTKAQPARCIHVVREPH